MELIISPKDTTAKIQVPIEFHWQEGEMFCIRLPDGTIRKYPLQHIWYVAFKEDNQ